MEDLERFLALVCRELDAHDAHLRLGGKDPSDPRTVFAELEPGVRLVASFTARPAEPGRVRDRLVALARSFDGTVQKATRATRHVGSAPAATSDDDLTHALNVLADRIGAAAVVIIDDRSPVLWGRSDAAAFVDDVEECVEEGQGLAADSLAGITDPADRLRVVMVRAIAAARTSKDNQLVRGKTSGFSIRKFAGIYRLVLAFNKAFSPLHVETTVSKALPAIERLVEGLPPVEPPPTRARVTPLRPV